MTRNAKTVWVVAIVAAVVVLLTLAWFGRDLIQGRAKTITCSDGPRRTIDIRDFVTKHSAYSVELEADIANKAKFSGKVSPIQLQQISESVQSANEFRKYVVAGYDSCAITNAQYALYGARFQALDSLSRQINDLTAKSELSSDEEAQISNLIQQYGELAGKLGTE
jgi:hypothetical protein